MKVILSFILITGLMVLSGCGCKKGDPYGYRISMEVWGPLDDSVTYEEILDAFKGVSPQVIDIQYKKVNYDTYEKELLEALATEQGPDIILIHNNWLPSFKSKLAPAPPEILNEQKYRQEFVDISAQDFVVDGNVWAAPLSVDSLGLYYNKDLFNEAGITKPPTDWIQFSEDAAKMTKINNFNEVVQSGAALGTAYNINRSTDVLTMLMMQNGLSMVEDNNVTFDDAMTVNGEMQSPGVNALNFYTQFSRGGTNSYSWNKNMHYSIDAFSEGNLAMMFNYSWQIPTIESKSPKLNYSIAPIPQFPNKPKVSYGDYWAFAVVKNKKSDQVDDQTRIKESWRFIDYLTGKPDLASGSSFDPASEYLSKTNKPAARRDLIEFQKSDPKLGVFAAGNLIAKSWYQIEPDVIEATMAEMIDNVNKGQSTSEEAISTAAARIDLLMRK